MHLSSATRASRSLLRPVPPLSPARLCSCATTPCRPTRRPTRHSFSTTAAPLPPPPSGIAPLPSRRILHLSGPDAAKYLQSAVTANLLTPEGAVRTDSFYAAFLNAQGRIRHDVVVYPESGPDGGVEGRGFFIDVDAEQATTLAKIITRYKLRAKFDVKLLDANAASVWQVWDDDGGLDYEASQGGGAHVFRDTRCPGLGYRVLDLRPTSGLPFSAALTLDPTTETAFRARRILRGVPEGQRELAAESSLPLEANMDLMGAIDFHKGCYVGQELTIRTKHRGVVRKRVLPCVVYGDGVPAPTELAYDPSAGGGIAAERVPVGASIGRVGKKGRSVGKWLGGVGNVGLALCRLEIMTDVVLPGEVAASPFDPAEEFIVDTEEAGGRVRIKAFVPEWIRSALPTGEWWASATGQAESQADQSQAGLD